MKRNWPIALPACALVLLGCAYPAVGQDGACPAGDYVCLDQHFGLACVNRMDGANGETCAAWLAELRSRPDVGAPEAQLLAGHTLRSLSTFGDDREMRASYRDQASAVFSRLVAENPAYVEALMALSSLVDTSEGRRELLRRAAAADPSDMLVVQSLAAAEDLPERIDLYERTYAEPHLRFGGAMSSSEGLRWRVARNLASAYRTLASSLASSQADASAVADAEARLAAFIGRVRDDFRIDAMLAQRHSDAADDPDGTAGRLSSLCRTEALGVFGGYDCIEALDAVAETAVAAGGSRAGLQLADLVATTMDSLPGSIRQLESAYPHWREVFPVTLGRLIASGADSPTVFRVYAKFETDPEARLNMLLHASEVHPEDAEVAVSLGTEYLLHGMRDAAIGEFLAAKRYLADRPQGSVDALLRIARGEQEMPAEWTERMSGEVER